MTLALVNIYHDFLKCGMILHHTSIYSVILLIFPRLFFMCNTLLRSIKGIESRKLFYVIVKYLSHFFDQVWLINMEGNLGKIMFDSVSYR